MSAGDGIRCPKCGTDTSVVETRQNRGSLRRRRACLARDCDGRITTVEMAAPRYSKHAPSTTDLVAMPRQSAQHLEVVPRALMQSLRDLLLANDVRVEAPEEHW